MSYSTIFVAVILNGLVALANFLNVDIGNDNAQAVATVIVQLATGVWIAYQRTKLQAAPGGVGDVKLSGVKK